MLSSIPAAIPFVFIDNARFLLVALFITGYSWARHTLGKPWLVGLSFLIGGMALVTVSIALGG